MAWHTITPFTLLEAADPDAGAREVCALLLSGGGGSRQTLRLDEVYVPVVDSNPVTRGRPRELRGTLEALLNRPDPAFSRACDLSEGREVSSSLLRLHGASGIAARLPPEHTSKIAPDHDNRQVSSPWPTGLARTDDKPLALALDMGGGPCWQMAQLNDKQGWALELAWPLSPLQAFAIALVAISRGCEGV